MSEIVGVFAASHTPVMLNFAELAAESERNEVFGAFAALGRDIEATRPDALVVFSDDHLHNFFLDNLPAFCVGAAEGYQTPAEHWLKADRRRLQGDADLGAYLIAQLLEAEFDPSLSMELILDHGVLTPLELAGVSRSIPIVPVMFNCVQPPMPTMKRCYDFGAAIGDALRRCDIVGRVAVLATGGISHDVATPRMGLVNEAFDRRFLALLGAGEAAPAIDFSTEQVNTAGNGGEEIRMWLAAMGVARGMTFRNRYYRPMQGWYTGIGLANWEN